MKRLLTLLFILLFTVSVYAGESICTRSPLTDPTTTSDKVVYCDTSATVSGTRDWGSILDDLGIVAISGGATNSIIYYDQFGVPQVLQFGTSGYVLTSNGPSAAPTWQAASGGASTFLGLTDTPSVSDYTDHAGDYIRVNSTPDGLEFVTPSATPWMEPITKDSPTASTYRWFKADAVLTVTGFDVIEAAADTGTITVDVYECSSTGTSCASILSAPVTATATGASATITDTSIASGAWVEIVYGTPSGSVSQVAGTLKGTR